MVRFDCNSSDTGAGRFKHFAAENPGSPQQHGRQNNKHNRFRVLNQGSSSIEFLIVSVVVFFLVFASSDYFITMSQHQISKHILHYYLERVRVEGYLTAEDQADMAAKFDSAGMVLKDIQECPMESRGDVRVLRNPANPDASEINMKLIIEPKNRSFVVGALVGGNVADRLTMKVGGSVLSERVDP